MRPLADHLGVRQILSNRLDFRDGIATGRLLDPVIRPRGAFAKLRTDRPDGTIARSKLLRDLGFAKKPEALDETIRPAQRTVAQDRRSRGSLRFAAKIAFPSPFARRLRGKHILLIGGTGFIGKVWLANLLTELPEIGRMYLLIRSHRSTTALQRFERMVSESPVFDQLAERHGDGSRIFCASTWRWWPATSSKPGLGLDTRSAAAPGALLDLIVNSAGLTDFNPDLRDALAMNVHATDAPARFSARVRSCRAAASFHLLRRWTARRPRSLEDFVEELHACGPARISTRAKECAVARSTDPRNGSARRIRRSNRRASPAGARTREHASKNLQGAALDNQIRKNRIALAAPDALTRRRHAARQRAGLAEYLHVHQKSFGIADRRLRGGDAAARDCDRAAVDRGIFDREAISSAGTKASTLRRRFPICWARSSASCRRTNANAWT